MHMNSTEFLNWIAEHRYCLRLERAAPAGRLKRDLITIVGADMSPVGLALPSGFRSNRVELPHAIFYDFLAASFIEPLAPEDDDGRIFYGLTADGRARGLAPAS